MRRTFDQGVFFSNVECKQVLEKAHCKKKGLYDGLMVKVCVTILWRRLPHT